MTLSLDSPTPEVAPPRPHRGGGLFRAFWRWHFYASFVVIPVLLVLAVTGLVYLFRFQLEPLLHPDLMQVERPAGATGFVSYDTQLGHAAEAYPEATAVSVAEPREEGRPTVVSMSDPDGATRDVFVDPWTGDVLGSLDPDGTVSGTAVRLHGDLMSGMLGEVVIELVACWSIVMALTGYYLFVKGRAARRRQARARRPGARLRSRHGLVGAVVGVGLLGMLVTGLPWTGLWGAKVQQLVTAGGTSMWSADPGAASDPTSSLDESLPHSHAVEVPWALQESEVPRSDADADHLSVADVDTAVVVAGREGLRHPMTVALPQTDDDTFSVIGYAFDAPSDERTVHVDRFGGQVVSTYGYDDYPALAKVVSQGIGLHEGRSLGLASMVGAAAFCLAVVFLCVSGPLMWWRRRPRGVRTGAPRGRLPLRSTPWLVAALVGLGLLLPLFGLSLLVVLALDHLVLRRVPAASRFFETI